MARSRNIKPGFFANESLADCEPLARLLFISLWLLADRDGRLENRPKKIKVQTFPYEECDILDLLSQIERAGFIFSYIADGVSIIQVNNWSKHQNPHHKEVESELPRYDKSKHELCTPHARVEHEPNTVCEGYIPLNNTIRRRIFERDGYKCAYCGSDHSPEIDHIHPVSKGGNSVDDNLQVLCKACNSSKGNELVNQALSIKHGRVILESSMDQLQVMTNASCPTDSLNLIPSSLIPDTGLPLSVIGKPSRANALEKENPDFDRFWIAYPRKVGKADAKKAWIKAKPDIDRVIYALTWQVNSQDWTKDGGAFIPHPSTYINQGRWDDEPSEIRGMNGQELLEYKNRQIAQSWRPAEMEDDNAAD